MNRLTVSLLAALDAVIALAVGVAVPLVPLTVIWGVQFSLAADWLPFWRAACDIWLLGHGVDVTVTLDPVTAAGFGLSGQTVFTVTVAALGFALLTAVLGSRTGRRAWATPHPLLAAVVGIAVFAGLSVFVTLSAHTGPIVPSLLQGCLLPAFVFGLGVALGWVAAEVHDRGDSALIDLARGDTGRVDTGRVDTGRIDTGRIEAGRIDAGRSDNGRSDTARPEAARIEVASDTGRVFGRRAPTSGPTGAVWPFDRLSASTRCVLAAGLRGGVAASLLLISASALLLAVLLAVNYARIIGLYESLHPGILGAVVLTLAQLALLPNAVLWTASWLAGPGFALGTGSSIDVTQTLVGPLPNVPLLGALPQHDPGFGLVAVIVPVLCGALAATFTRARLERMPAPRTLRSYGSPAARGARASAGFAADPASGGWGAGRLALVALVIGVVAGAVMGLLTWWSAGAIGPGRLQHAGPGALLVAAAVAVETLVGAAIGISVRHQSEEASAPSSVRVSLRERRAMREPEPARVPGSAGVPGPAWRTAPARKAERARALEPAGDAWPFTADGDWRDDAEPATDPIPVVASSLPSAGSKSAKGVRGSAATEPEPTTPKGSGAGQRAQDARAASPTSAAAARTPAPRVPQRPNAPRVPAPRSRPPRPYSERPPVDPDFARHESDDTE